MKYIRAVTSLPRFYKRLVLLGYDIGLVPLTLYIALSQTFGPTLVATQFNNKLLFFVGISTIGAGLILLLGLSRVKVASFENKAIQRTAICAVAIASVALLISQPLGAGIPPIVFLIFAALFFVGSVGGRMIWQSIVEKMEIRDGVRKRVLIFGAGSAGIQLISALRQSSEMHAVAIMDDNRTTQGLIVGGLTVMAPENIDNVVELLGIDRIILAVPSLQGRKRQDIVARFSHLDCDIQVLPSMLELADGRGLVKSLRPVSADDLLGRDKIDLDLPEVAASYSGKCIMVTGAGGSIGSELCRQLFTCGIEKLVLFEHSEFALYSLNQELAPIAEEMGIKLSPVLGTVIDPISVQSALRDHHVQIVLHAAAYKHVPLVEENELAGLRNNVIGTRVVAEAARKQNLERFILVSTDKAVRPTNVMGASKRLAELIVQDLATRSGKTLFSMVRFGNVLGSSGSVIPLFQSQIAAGGPVTVTHDDVTRYFMTIPEAARLVLLAGSFARGGDVFVLDMGQPVKIRDLAQSMIELSGLRVRDEENPEGDIEINVTGLRPGEKLYEELLIGGDMLTTPHQKILRAQESSISELEMANVVRDLIHAFENNDTVAARAVIERWVDGYQRPMESGA